MLEANNIRIAARGVRQDILWKAMRADEKVGLQYASKYSGSSNGWKKWIGEREAFEALEIIPRQKQKEKELEEWIASDPARSEAWGGAVDKIAKSVADTKLPLEAATLLGESIGRIELLNFAAAMDRSYSMAKAAAEKNPDVNLQDAIDAVFEYLGDAYKDYNEDVDRKVAAAMIDFYKQNLIGSPIILGGKDIRKIDTKRLVDNMFKKSVFTSEQKALSKPITEKLLDADPAVRLYRALMETMMPLRGQVTESQKQLADATKAYAASLLEWKKGEPSYPDANSTCRLTYGTVKSYEPKDGVLYKYYTTLKGVMEKEDPDNYEFRVPERLKEIFNTKDYGQYADANGELVTCFLTNLDITGGNSGSPVMDADGNLIGLAFDGNWEAMSSDVMFEPNLQRCICVDIRYVLLMMDKFGGAGYLLDEMNIVKND
jgi:hypothetical protein